MNVYFDKEEAAFVLSQEKGWLRKLVRKAMEFKEFESRHQEPVHTETSVKDPTVWNPQRDTFGPRLKS